jgi:hypothetical protein
LSELFLFAEETGIHQQKRQFKALLIIPSDVGLQLGRLGRGRTDAGGRRTGQPQSATAGAVKEDRIIPAGANNAPAAAQKMARAAAPPRTPARVAK